MNNEKKQALELLEQALKDFESDKGSISSGVLKLNRAAQLVNKTDISKWCELNLGNEYYLFFLKRFTERASKYKNSKDEGSEETAKLKEEYKEAIADMMNIGLLGAGKNNKFTYPILSNREINLKANESTGGYRAIGFLEQKYTTLTKTTNDGTIYRTLLIEHIQAIRNNGHKRASELYKELAFVNSTKDSFEILKNSVEDRLLDLNVDLAEQIILAFKSIQTDNEEEWSQALTTCRRFLEGLADLLYPPTDTKIGGKLLGKSNYINRIWAFMDENIESDSNKDLAKNHIDFLGSYLQKTFRLTNKGVHSGITKIEAIKTVFHTYLIVVDLLSYLKIDIKPTESKLNINKASLDELEVILGIKRNIAKEIVKSRMENGKITVDLLKAIKGVGKKIIDIAIEKYNIE